MLKMFLLFNDYSQAIMKKLMLSRLPSRTSVSQSNPALVCNREPLVKPDKTRDD